MNRQTVNRWTMNCCIKSYALRRRCWLTLGLLLSVTMSMGCQKQDRFYVVLRQVERQATTEKIDNASLTELHSFLVKYQDTDQGRAIAYMEAERRAINRTGSVKWLVALHDLYIGEGLSELQTDILGSFLRTNTKTFFNGMDPNWEVYRGIDFGLAFGTPCEIEECLRNIDRYLQETKDPVRRKIAHEFRENGQSFLDDYTKNQAERPVEAGSEEAQPSSSQE